MVATQSLPRAETRAQERKGLSFASGASGLLILLLGAWAGIVPFIGPIFGFSADGTGSWSWSLSHALLFLVPGAAAAVAGFLVMSRVPRLTRAGGLLAVLAGAWFVVGPLAWPVLEGSSFYSAASSLREFTYWIGYSVGPGALLIALGGFVVGCAVPFLRADGNSVSTTEAVPDASDRPERLAS